ncbi:MAG TPA: magnesium transporter, partial [Candidatus Doudnabacteria bacterium]|nr:magnesium transporter [Candidatus Doudnabacteria bacterium]
MREPNKNKLEQYRKRTVSVLAHSENSHKDLMRTLKDVDAQTAASLVTILSQWRPEVYLGLPEALRLEVMDLISLHVLKNLIDRLGDMDLVWVMTHSTGPIRTKLLRLVNQSRIEDLEHLLIDDLKNQLKLHANYPRRSIGRIMQPTAPVITLGQTVHEAGKQASNYEQQIGTIHNLYVVSSTGNYLGNVSLIDLLTASGQQPIDNLIQKNLPTFSPHATQNYVAHIFQEYDLLDAPVLQGKKVVGMVLVEDILDVLQQQYLQGLQQLGGRGVSDETTDTPPMLAAKRRLPWMVGNIFLDLIAVSVIMPFEETIGQVTALAVLMPIVSDMGGNVGVQALTVSARSLMDSSKVDWKILFSELRRELTIGVVNGVVLGIVIGLVGFLGWGNPWLGLVAAVALSVNTVVASVAGGVLPIILKKYRQDPALMSGAVLTTITDFTGFLLFLGLATL